MLLYDFRDIRFLPRDSRAVKIFATIGLSIAVIIASLFCYLSSTCAVASTASSDRTMFVFFALVFLAVAIGGVMRIAKINRNQ